jgi:uncharacterized tellurite resistance protein B-like protein
MIANLPATLGALIDKISAANSVESAESRATAIDLSVKVMSLVCLVDGRVDAAEVRQVQNVYREHVGSLIEPATIERAFRIAADDEDEIWRQLRAARSLEEELRKEIFKTAIDVAVADRHLHDDEFDMLKQLGTTFDLPHGYVEKQVIAARARQA